MSLLALGLGVSLLSAFPEKVISLTAPEQPEVVLKVDYGAAQALYAEWLIAQKKPAASCSCVTFAKQLSGINVGSIGVAKNHPINSQTPQIGAIVVTSEGPVGHLAVVIGIGEDTITIKESNFVPCKTTVRTLNIGNPVIRGYYK